MSFDFQFSVGLVQDIASQSSAQDDISLWVNDMFNARLDILRNQDTSSASYRGIVQVEQTMMSKLQHTSKSVLDLQDDFTQALKNNPDAPQYSQEQMQKLFDESQQIRQSYLQMRPMQE